MAQLFEPIRFRSIELKNRIGVSPMCQYSSVDGRATDWHLVHLGSRAVGGAGLIIFEATAVQPEGRISPSDAGLWSDDQIDPLAHIIKFLKEHNAVAGIQLAHAGRKASTARPWERDSRIQNRMPNQLGLDEGGWIPLAPSTLAFSPHDRAPHMLTHFEIQSIVQAFGDAAHRALQAGFEIIEIHAAHGYLLHSFLSPLSNTRTDEYGGSFENRLRLTREVVREVRTHWPDHLPLFLRVSATDWSEGGWTLNDSIQLAHVLKQEGVDLIDCSSGGLIPDVKIPVVPGYQIPFSAAIRKEVQIATAAVGLITNARHANEVLEKNEADLIFLAREMLRDPYWPYHAARELGALASLKLPRQYSVFL